jgi:hypothetical protein
VAGYPPAAMTTGWTALELIDHALPTPAMNASSVRISHTSSTRSHAVRSSRTLSIGVSPTPIVCLGLGDGDWGAQNRWFHKGGKELMAAGYSRGPTCAFRTRRKWMRGEPNPIDELNRNPEGVPAGRVVHLSVAAKAGSDRRIKRCI